MTSLIDPYAEAERGVERATKWKPSDEDPLRVGKVEQWKLITPRDRPDEPVWLVELRDRDGVLHSLFVSQAALLKKLCGIELPETLAGKRAAIAAADPDTFPAAVGKIAAVRFEGKHPHPERPGQSVTRWTVNIVTPPDEELTPIGRQLLESVAVAATGHVPEPETEAADFPAADDGLPF